MCVCMCEKAGAGWGGDVHFLTGDSISQLPLFVSLSVYQYLFLTHPLSPVVAEQLQADADGGGVWSEAQQVHPGNQFLLPPF